VEVAELDSTLTALTYYRNGSQTATATFTNPLQAVSPGFTVGSLNGGGNGWYGDISEVLVYDHHLSTAELQQVGVYLANKYGLYNPNATWPQAYSSDVQAQITANQWNKAQADAFVAFQNSSGLPVTDGIAAWFKADAGVTTSSGSVTQWNDQSPNQYNITQTAGSSAPTPGTDAPTGKSVVSFNGSQFLASTSQIANVNDVTIITVGSAPNIGESGVQVQVGTGWGSACNRGFAYVGGHEAFTNGINNSGYFTSVSGGPAIQNAALTTNAVTYSASSGTASFYSNGTSNGTASISTVATAAGLIMGDSITYGNYYNWTGNIAEVLIYNRVLSASELQQVEFYLANKYAIIPTINSATTAAGTIGAPFSYAITTNGVPASYSATGLPAGLSINTSTGIISGTPTVTGVSTVTLNAINAGGTGTATLTLTINPALPPVISSNTTAGGTLGEPFTYTITTINTPTSFTATGLPNGLTLNTSTGVISGTATATGTSTVALSAINGSGTGTATLTLIITPALSVTSGLQAWFRAESGVVANSNGYVSQWTDQTTNQIVASNSTQANQPTLVTLSSGQQALSFSGNQNLFNSATVPNINDVTIITVASASNPANSGVQIHLGYGNASGVQTGLRGLSYDSSNQAFVSGTSGNIPSDVTGGAVPATSTCVINDVSYNHVSNTASFYSNGQLNGTASVNPGVITPQLWIGALGTNGVSAPYNWNGTISEVLIFDHVLTDSDRQAVEGYLGDKYGIYSPYATWVQQYSSTIQAQIAANFWNRAQATAYVAFANANPQVLTYGLNEWLEADQGTVLSSGGVTTWQDQTWYHNDATQTTHSAMPTVVTNALAGHSVIRFDGVAQTLISPAPPPTVAGTLFVIYRKPTSGGVSGQDVLTLTSDGTTDQSISISPSTSNGGSVGSNRTFEAVQPFGTFILTVYPRNLTIGSAGDQEYYPYNWTNWNFFQGDIAEIMVYNRVLSTSEQNQVTQYLADKYQFYSPSATWPQSYTSAVQAEIAANGWTKTQADNYVALLASNPPIPTTGLGVWLKADQSVNVDGSNNVTSWQDQGINQNNAISTGNTATEPQLVSNALNGKPVVRFSGGQYLHIIDDPSLTPATGYTIISVANTNTASAQSIVSKPYTSTSYNSPYSSYGLGINSSGSIQSTQTTLTQVSNILSSPTPLSTGQPFLAATQYDGTTQQVVAQGQAGTAAFVSGGLDYGDTSEKDVTIGAVSTTTPQNYFNGDLAEVIVYRRALSPQELQQVEQYLATKYGVSYSGTAPVISPAAGSYSSSVSVSISGALTGQTIHYTIDGTTPTASSPLYSSSFTLTGSALVQAGFFSGSQLIGVTSASQFYVNDPGQTGLASAPSGVLATLASPGEIDLSWTLNGMQDYSGINIYRQVDGGAFELLTTLSAGATSFADLTVLPGHSYVYQIGAANASGVAESAASSSVTNTAPPTQTITITQPTGTTPLP
jgi:hypothetical protein